MPGSTTGAWAPYHEFWEPRGSAVRAPELTSAPVSSMLRHIAISSHRSASSL
jgi:hypothetical protein